MANKAIVAICIDFMTAFAKLPRYVQGKVTEFIDKFRINPTSPGINYEKINGSKDKKICSVRIDDTYRGIVVRQSETGVYLLLWVDHHDEAYEWARNKKCIVNPETGAIQIYDTVISAQDNISSTVDSFLFSGISDKDLLSLGVPEDMLTLTKSIHDAEEFYSKRNNFPADAYENLSWLVEGDSIDVVKEYAKQNLNSGTISDNFADALESPETLKSFVVIEGEDELHRIMAEPLEKWRVFLHPAQRKIVNNNYSGAARVLGGAGTGKTVVAIHRAKHLASNLADNERILFTTYTVNLAADIKENLRKICSNEEFSHIEVINLDAWVSQFLRECNYDANIIYDDKLSKIWRAAVTDIDKDKEFPASFYEDEYNRVVAAQEAFSLDKYIKASRIGRGTRLDRKKRMQIWKVFETYQKMMEEQKFRDINTAMYECRMLLLQTTIKHKYKHVIVDEGQDLSANAFRLLRAIAGEEHPNDIFIVGDAHQRIYKNKAVLSKCGINIRGRSNTLYINYRTTEEIRKAAFALLNGISFDDLDNNIDSDDQCQSLTHGTPPQVLRFSDEDEEFNGIFKEIRSLLDNGVSANNICVVARTHNILNSYIDFLSAKGLRCYEVKRSKSDDRSLDGIRVATMHRIKGLEFQYVFVVAANKKIIPLYSVIDHTDQVSFQETTTAEKCLLYVALTRAQKGAYISGYGQMSEFLERT